MQRCTKKNVFCVNERIDVASKDLRRDTNVFDVQQMWLAREIGKVDRVEEGAHEGWQAQLFFASTRRQPRDLRF